MVVFISIYGGLNVYPASHIYKSLKLFCHNFHPLAFVIIYSLVALTVPLSFLKRKYAFQDLVYSVGSCWLGIFVYMFLFTLLADIVFLVMNLFSLHMKEYASASGTVIIILTFIVIIYGTINAMTVRTTRYEAHVENLPEPLKLALITDIHIGAVGMEKRLPKIVDRINAEGADIVCIAGDIFNNDFDAIKDPEFVRGQFSRIASTYGVYACLGNHDRGDGYNDMLSLLRSAGINLLVEESACIPGKCIIVGRADGVPPAVPGGEGRGAYKGIAPENPDALPVIVLDHNPAHIGEYGKDVSLVLCGHTHNGQIFPGNLIVKAMYENAYGQYKRNSKSPTVIVSSGVGYWGPPVRTASKSEIVTISLN